MNIYTITAVAGALAFATSGWCQTGITTSGQVRLTAPPNSLLPGAYESDAAADLFLENLDLVLPGSLAIDASQPGLYNSSASLTPSTLAAGTAVSSYYFHADPVTSTGTPFSGSITFGTNILGVIESTATLAATDSILGTSGVAYSGVLPGRGLELQGHDSFAISADSRTLSFSVMTWSVVDDMRIVTAASGGQNAVSQQVAPEPASVGLAAIALGAGLWFRRRIASPRQ